MAKRRYDILRERNPQAYELVMSHGDRSHRRTDTATLPRTPRTPKPKPDYYVYSTVRTGSCFMAALMRANGFTCYKVHEWSKLVHRDVPVIVIKGRPVIDRCISLARYRLGNCDYSGVKQKDAVNAARYVARVDKEVATWQQLTSNHITVQYKWISNTDLAKIGSAIGVELVNMPEKLEDHALGKPLHVSRPGDGMWNAQITDAPEIIQQYESSYLRTCVKGVRNAFKA